MKTAGMYAQMQIHKERWQFLQHQNVYTHECYEYDLPMINMDRQAYVKIILQTYF